jgi:CheY-like chemotaxis protein
MECGSLRDARSVLLDQTFAFDVILLDMSIPMRGATSIDMGGSVRQNGGIELLRLMKRSEIICPVIVVTQFDKFTEYDTIVTLKELTDEMETEFRGTFQGAVYYRASSSAWTKELGRLLHLILIKNRMPIC